MPNVYNNDANKTEVKKFTATKRYRPTKNAEVNIHVLFCVIFCEVFPAILFVKTVFSCDIEIYLFYDMIKALVNFF